MGNLLIKLFILVLNESKMDDKGPVPYPVDRDNYQRPS